ncbi:MAG: hypothetical protein WCT02_00190 [Candidatus Paceibacterota bacterium]|jgi:predicted ATP-grasp superfamily ATP-dependent carboligase
MSKKIKNIIIANETEAFAKIISCITDKRTRAEKIDFEDYLANRSLFWEGDDKIVISSVPIIPALLDSVTDKVGFRNVFNWHPSKKGMNLSSSIFQDKKLLEKLKKVIRENPTVLISPYAFTKELRRLLDNLRKSGLTFSVDQEPERSDYRIVSRLDSKKGFRLEMESLRESGEDIVSPIFRICKNRAEALAVLTYFHENNLSCIVKASYGEGGWGLITIHRENFTSAAYLRKYVRERFLKDPIWKSGPIVIEEFIASNNGWLCSPSVEFFIDKNGTNVTYICNQLLDKSGAFIGAYIGKGCVGPIMKASINRIGIIIARHYWALGYRGFFDIDFVISASGAAVPIETNARRTGGTHLFDLARYIFGDNWQSKISALSADSFEYGKKVLPASYIYKKMKPILFPIKGTRKGIVITLLSIKKPVLGFVIFGSNREEVLRIRAKLTHIWKRDIVMS